MGSSLLDSLGQMHVISGRVIYTTNVGALTSCNDNSASLTVTTINPTITVEGFTSGPEVACTYLKAANSDTTLHYVTCEQATSAGVLEFRIHSIVDSGVDLTNVVVATVADGDGFMFICVGMRNN